VCQVDWDTVGFLYSEIQQLLPQKADYSHLSSAEVKDVWGFSVPLICLHGMIKTAVPSGAPIRVSLQYVGLLVLIFNLPATDVIGSCTFIFTF